MNLVKSPRMERKSIRTILLLLCAVSVAAMATDDSIQPKTVPYKDSAGNTQTLSLLGGDGLDQARSLICSKDDSCTVFGYTNKSFGDTTDFLAIHLSPKSDITWAETFGGTNLDMLYNAIPTSDGGYFTSGDSASVFFTGLKIFSPHRDPRPMYVKLDASGKLLWAGNVELGTQITGAEIAKTIQTSDGGYLLVGSYSEAYPDSGQHPMPDEWSGPGFGSTKGWRYFYPLVVKLAADGKPQWMRRYAFGDKGGMATSFATMPSGHFLVAGSILTEPDNKLFIMEIDAQGAPLYTQQYDLPAAQGSNAFLRLQDGSYMVVGHANAQKAPPRAFSALLSADGKFISGTIYGEPDGLRPLGLIQAADGRICIVGRTENGNTNKAEGVAWLTDEHTSDLGEFWLTGAGNTELEDVAPLSSGGFRLLGDTAAFGAAAYDLITATWVPNVSATATPAKRITEEPYKPTISDVPATSDTGKLDLVRVIPVELIKVQALGVPAAGPQG